MNRLARQSRFAKKVVFATAFAVLVSSSFVAGSAAAQPRRGTRSEAVLPVESATPAAIPTEVNPYAGQEDANPYTEDPATTEVNPYASDAAIEPATVAEAATEERIKTHWVGLGFHTTTFATQSGNGYSLSGPSVVYGYFVGRRWGFAMRGEAYFPMTARMAGNGVDIRTSVLDNYSRAHYGFDGSFMAAYRHVFGQSFVLTAAAGLHFQSFRLVSIGNNPIEAITGGFALSARGEYRINRHFAVGGEFALGVDPFDFVAHSNRATVTVPVTVGLGASFSY